MECGIGDYMKMREDFVTNSSSSSFIISKDDVSYDRLLEILLEIANEEAEKIVTVGDAVEQIKNKIA